ncbi:Serine/threonine-protein phosphatase 2B catalytic subunit beta [Pelomyxa schiedti]|nr:Serine/threonine-protein phosphatase 2B catalytic subunit beta [Pelomyxa schiedti]
MQPTSRDHPGAPPAVPPARAPDPRPGRAACAAGWPDDGPHRVPLPPLTLCGFGLPPDAVPAVVWARMQPPVVCVAPLAALNPSCSCALVWRSNVTLVRGYFYFTFHAEADAHAALENGLEFEGLWIHFVPFAPLFLRNRGDGSTACDFPLEPNTRPVFKVPHSATVSDVKAHFAGTGFMVRAKKYSGHWFVRHQPGLVPPRLSWWGRAGVKKIFCLEPGLYTHSLDTVVTYPPFAPPPPPPPTPTLLVAEPPLRVSDVHIEEAQIHVTGLSAPKLVVATDKMSDAPSPQQITHQEPVRDLVCALSTADNQPSESLSISVAQLSLAESQKVSASAQLICPPLMDGSSEPQTRACPTEEKRQGDAALQMEVTPSIEVPTTSCEQRQAQVFASVPDPPQRRELLAACEDTEGKVAGKKRSREEASKNLQELTQAPFRGPDQYGSPATCTAQQVPQTARPARVSASVPDTPHSSIAPERFYPPPNPIYFPFQSDLMGSWELLFSTTRDSTLIAYLYTSHKKFITEATDVLKNRSLLNEVVVTKNVSSINIVGDLRGNWDCLKRAIAIGGEPSDSNLWIFNGDYIDRGAFGLDVLAALCLLVTRYPQSVYLNRGNHECPKISSYGQNNHYQCLKEVYGSNGMRLWQECVELFKNLPLATLITFHDPEMKGWFVSHGGIGANVTLEAIRQSERHHETTATPLLKDLLWADPSEENGMLHISPQVFFRMEVPAKKYGPVPLEGVQATFGNLKRFYESKKSTAAPPQS